MANQYADALYKAINTIANDATQDLAAKLPEYFVGKVTAAASGDTTGYVVQILGSSREYECSASSVYKVNDVVMVQTNGSTHTIIGYAEQPFELQKFFNFYYDSALKCYNNEQPNNNLLTAQIRCGGDMIWFSVAVKSENLDSTAIDGQKLQISIFKDNDIIIEKYITINDIEGNPYDIDDTLKYKIEIPKEYLDLTSSYSISFTNIGNTSYFSNIQAWVGRSNGTRFNYEVGFKLKAKTITQQSYTDQTSLTINYKPLYRTTYDVKAGLEIGGIDLFNLTGGTVSNLTYYIAGRPLPTGQTSIRLSIDTYRGSDPTEIKAIADWTLGTETWHLQTELPVKVINYPKLWIERSDSGTGLNATLKIDGDSVSQPTYEPWSEPTGSEASGLPRVQYNWKCTNPDTIVENGGPEFTPTGSQETDLTKWECSAFVNSNINSPSEAFNDYIGTAQLAVGEKGDKGDTVRTIEAFYQKNTSTIPTAPTSGAPPTGNWTTTEPTVSSINKYIFKSTTTLTNDTAYGDWTTPILYQQYVANGTSATNYYITANHDSLHRDATGSYEESSITFSAYSKTGSNAAISASVWWSWEYGSGSGTITGGPTGTFNSLAFDIGSGTGKIQPEQQLLVKILLTRTATAPLAQIVVPVEAILPNFIKEWDGKATKIDNKSVCSFQAGFGRFLDESGDQTDPTINRGFCGIALGEIEPTGTSTAPTFSGIIGYNSTGSTGSFTTEETFRLDAQDGSIIARKGEIAGWIMQPEQLYSGTGSSYISLYSGTNEAYEIADGEYIRLCAGNDNIKKAPFKLTNKGTLFSTNGVFSGQINAQNFSCVEMIKKLKVQTLANLSQVGKATNVRLNLSELSVNSSNEIQILVYAQWQNVSGFDPISTVTLDDGYEIAVYYKDPTDPTFSNVIYCELPGEPIARNSYQILTLFTSQDLTGKDVAFSSAGAQTERYTFYPFPQYYEPNISNIIYCENNLSPGNVINSSLPTGTMNVRLGETNAYWRAILVDKIEKNPNAGTNQSHIGTSSSPYGSGYFVNGHITNNCYIKNNCSPSTNNSGSLGTENYVWNTAYINTVYRNSEAPLSSDRNKKNSITPLSNQYVEIIDRLQPVTFKYNDGTSGRIHPGFIAQDVEQIIEDVGLTSQDISIVVRDNMGEENEAYYLRYENFIPLCVAKIQQQSQQIAELQTELAEIKTLLQQKGETE